MLINVIRCSALSDLLNNEKRESLLVGDLPYQFAYFANSSFLFDPAAYLFEYFYQTR